MAETARRKQPAPAAAVVEDVGAVEDAEDRVVLSLVLDESTPRPWSLDELESELGSRVVAGDAVRRLRGAGLLHQLEAGYVFPTRAAVRAQQLLVY